MHKTIRILSIDGGGIRGIIPAVILAELERIAETPVAAMFDLIAGTSTGGLIALGLTKPGSEGKSAFTAEEFVDLYVKDGPSMFKADLFSAKGLRGPRYSGEAIEKVLGRYFDGCKLSNAMTDVLVTSYDLLARDPYYFTRHEARTDPCKDFEMAKVARATSAAPTYFPPAHYNGKRPLGLVDGGVFANNPAMLAFAEAQRLFGRDNDFVLVSLSTGESAKTIPIGAAQRFGFVGWANCVLDIVYDAVSDSVDHQLEWLFPDDRYHRLGKIHLDDDQESMDNVEESNIIELRAKAKAYVEQRQVKSELQTICKQLTAANVVAANA